MGKRELMATTAFSVLILAYPTGDAAAEKPCPDGRTDTQCIACSAAHGENKCGMGAKDCHYKFTVKEVVNDKKINVTYPPSVWSVTMEAEKNTEAEIDFKKEYESKEIHIGLTAMSSTPTAGKTYLFTRCPDHDYTLGAEIRPDDETVAKGTIKDTPAQKQ